MPHQQKFAVVLMVDVAVVVVFVAAVAVARNLIPYERLFALHRAAPRQLQHVTTTKTRGKS